MYEYPRDPVHWFDPYGLIYTYYELYNQGKLVYVGITERFEERLKEHARGARSQNIDPKTFDQVKSIGNIETRRDARNIEGSSLTHHVDEKLDNKRKNDESFYHAYDKEKVKHKKGHKFYELNELEGLLKNAQIQNVGAKGHLIEEGNDLKSSKSKYCS